MLNLQPFSVGSFLVPAGSVHATFGLMFSCVVLVVLVGRLRCSRVGASWCFT